MTNRTEGARRFLPPMGVLNSFAAAARLGSFSAAGAEVGLTQSAVSRQIALLEDALQRPLFDRAGRRISLNADGQSYADEIAPALDRIRRATARLASRRPANELNIATLPSFGMRWLAPRLPRLSARHPDLVVNFAARSIPFDLSTEGFDAAIHFGLPDWPDATHDFLFREQALPVCAPGWLQTHPIHVPEDFLNTPLLFQSSRRSAWDRWLAHAGVDAPPVSPGPVFEHFLMLAQAAAAGSGAALIPSFLIEPELAAGTLVCPLHIPLSTDEAYWLVHPRGGAANPALERFRAWLADEVG
ncbi:LysR family transcriptional regulator [Sandaracinobacter neustonicus]|uniref:LysR family transcriptional regulator n=1 Tax=Sandaracinobacter neustonicus TaxID=1715348 RepID=A0A501XMG2_9SPHN|nr:LysR substrate-binding domain-containing protein [Sandaracinobacter neustonicus]TPE61838.1 LysR family transcriptional regulator [Sandaracinobacter neustonicus]